MGMITHLPPPRPRYACVQMRSRQVLDSAIDDNDIAGGASACGTAAALLFPSFYSCVAPMEGELAYATTGRDRPNEQRLRFIAVVASIAVHCHPSQLPLNCRRTIAAPLLPPTTARFC